MESAKRRILDIVSTSQRVISAGTQYASCRGFRGIPSCHFRLEKEMQRISVAAEGMLGVLSKSSLPNSPPLDDRLQEWFSTDEPLTCLDTLNQMEGMLQSDTWINTMKNFANTLRSSPPEDKISAAVKLFDSRKNYFHFLLTTDLWNYEEPRQQPRARGSAHAQDGPAVELVLEPTTKVDRAINSVLTPDEGRVDDPRKLDGILRWLDGLNCTAKQEEILSLRQPDTCTWLNSTSEYESWRNSDDSSLWLQGKPGSGKTVLASFVVDSLKNQRRDGETLALFYCDFRNDRSTSAAEVMRSLLSQLFRHIRNGNIDLGELVDDLTREKDGDTPILTDVKYLATFVSQTAKQFSRQPLVVVDALDECKDVEKLLDGLLILAKGSLRLFVTSRPLQTIKDGLRGIPSISMDEMASAVSSDIALHVTRELDSRRRLRDLELGVKLEIHTILCDRADGMFRWVQCQIDTLNQCATRAEVREALDNLPIGLEETYRRILLAIDTGSPEGKLALRALTWLVGALRPLRLPEILDGLTLDLGRWLMDPDTGPMHKGALLDACSSLVTYNEGTDILILSHFSVKEYLTGDLTRAKLPRYHISYQGAHEHLARLCICYVTLYLRHVHGSSEKTSLSRIMHTIDGRSHNAAGQWSHSENPPTVLSMSQELLGYVFTDGFNHLAYLGSANRVVLKDMMTLQSDIQRHHDAWEVICRMSRPYKLLVPWPGQEHDFMLYILTAFASDSLLHAYLGRNRRVLKIKYQTNPLVYAAHFGKAKHAQLLLSHGAQVNERGLVVDVSRQALPLEVAVSRQHDVMVDLLLSTGSIVPRQLFTFSTNNNFPIRIARRLLQTDEFVEWAAEPGNRLPSPIGLLERRPPLVYGRDIIIMIRRLVQVGLDPAARNSAQKTALHLAIAGGYQAVVVYLLLIGTPLPFDFMSAVSKIPSSQRTLIFRLIADAGADSGTSEDTALHLAMNIPEQGECLEAVKILVGAGCKPFVHNKAGQTPVRLALEQRYFSVADYLLSQQGPAPLDVLSAVVRSGRPMAWRVGTVRMLIKGGANIHGVTTSGDRLLHQAVKSLDERQGLEMVKLLVGAGCDPLQRSVQGKTPLHIALDRKLPLLVDYLLSTGRPLPPDALFAVLDSALPTAWRAQTIHSLVSRGANPSELSANGNTLLHATVLALDEPLGLGVAKLLTGVGCDPFRLNKRDKTSLHIALDRRFPLLADCLLSTGGPVPPDALFSILDSALSMAWRAQTVCSLVRRGTNPSKLSANGNTLLHATVLALDEPLCLDVAKLLVGVGCDPFRLNMCDKTPLRIALDRKLPLLADYLLSTGLPLPPDTLFVILDSALPTAWRAQTIHSLVSRGANPSELSANGNTLLHATVLALDEPLGLGVAKLLTGVSCDPFRLNKRDKTSLHIALDRRFPLLADCLLSTGGPVPPDALFSILDSALPMVWRAQTVCSLVNRGINPSELSANGNTLLHATVLALDEPLCLDVAKLLVGVGCDPFRLNKCDKTPLCIALDRKLPLLADYLLSTRLPLPPDTLFVILDSALPTAWRAQTVCSLVSRGADPSELSANGNTLLHATLLALGEPLGLDVAKVLVGAGCGPLTRNKVDETPLHMALKQGYHSIADYLLSAGNPPVSDALFAVLTSRCLVDWIVENLHSFINAGTDVCNTTMDGNSPIHAVMLSQKEDACLELLGHLIRHGCNPWSRNGKGKSALHIAVERGFIGVMWYILALDQSVPDDILFSVLNSQFSDPRKRVILRILINKGANVHATVDGDTLLHIAISSSRNGYFSNEPFTFASGFDFPFDFDFDLDPHLTVETLVDGGCDAFASNSRGETPLHLAVAHAYISTVKYLLSVCTPPYLPDDILAWPLHGGVAHTNWEDTRVLLQLLIQKGANVHVPVADGGNLLHSVIKNCRLLQAPSRSRSPPPSPLPSPPPTPSYLSSLTSVSEGAIVWIDDNSLLEIITLLVDSGCNPSQCDADGYPPIYYAVLGGHVNVVRYLLRRSVPLSRNLLDATIFAPWRVRYELLKVLKRWISPV